MSELKAINAYQLTTNTEDSDVYIHNDDFGCGGDLVECYLKSEADKVIAHQKYRRCLAMARWCRIHDEFTQLESERLGLPHHTLFLEYRIKAMWWNKWHKRWLELAEKFKPNKEADDGND